MADAKRRHPNNDAGAWFVDTTCIDCDICREHEPAVFARHGEGTYVARPPRTPDETRRAWLALQACPVACIGATGESRPRDAVFPLRIDGPVWLCGFTLRETYGAQSYFIERPTGNLLIDSPRPAAPLLDWIDARGGLSEILLTHGDDVAKSDVTAARFGARIRIHEGDAGAAPWATERWTGNADREVEPGVRMIPVPGHTAGSVAFLLDDTWLFSGDSLAWDEDDGVYAFEDYCWDSWETQLRSLAGLATHRFRWILPGHGRRTPAAMDGLPEALARYAARAGAAR